MRFLQSLKWASPASLTWCTVQIKVREVFAILEVGQPRIAHLCTAQIKVREVLAILEVGQPRIAHLCIARSRCVRFLQSLKWASPASLTWVSCQIKVREVLAILEVGQPRIAHFRVTFQIHDREFKRPAGQIADSPDLPFLTVLVDLDAAADRQHPLGGAAVGVGCRIAGGRYADQVFAPAP